MGFHGFQRIVVKREETETFLCIKFSCTLTFSGGARIIVKYGQKKIANVYRVYIRNCQVNNKKI